MTYTLYKKDNSFRITDYSLRSHREISSVKSVIYDSYRDESITIYPIPQHLEFDETVYKFKSPNFIFANHLNINEKTKIWTSKECTFPKVLLKGKCTKVLNPNNADIKVFPKLNNNYEVIKIYVYKSNLDRYYFFNSRFYERNDAFYNSLNIGSKIRDINNNYYGFLSRYGDCKEEVNDLLDAELIYIGYGIINISQDEYDLLCGKYANILFENELMQFLQSGQSVDEDMIKSLKEGLRANDYSIVGNTLKLMSYMDYSTYSNTFKWLLYNNTRWEECSDKHLTSCKYMLRSLGFRRGRAGYNEGYSNVINPEDYKTFVALTEDYLKTQLSKFVNSVKDKFPFVDVDVDEKHVITPIYGKVELDKPEDDEDEE